jgi:hypothetical protein
MTLMRRRFSAITRGCEAVKSELICFQIWPKCAEQAKSWMGSQNVPQEGEALALIWIGAVAPHRLQVPLISFSVA